MQSFTASVECYFNYEKNPSCVVESTHFGSKQTVKMLVFEQTEKVVTKYMKCVHALRCTVFVCKSFIAFSVAKSTYWESSFK